MEKSVFEEEEQSRSIQEHKAEAPKDNIKILPKESSITDHQTVFEESKLKMKFEFIDQNMKKHFKEKLTVIGAKSRNDYVVAQENHGISRLRDGNVVFKLRGKLHTNFS